MEGVERCEEGHINLDISGLINREDGCIDSHINGFASKRLRVSASCGRDFEVGWLVKAGELWVAGSRLALGVLVEDGLLL
jgi:hypothetical protein